jgi:hypothetical protein
MGVVIRKGAAVEDIVRDVRVTLTNAAARGGLWKELAEARLSAVLSVLDMNAEQIQQAKQVCLPLKAELAARDDEADHLLGKISDSLWNEVGRPRSDPSIETLFPGGISYYTGGPTEEQPHRMELLATLLDARTHSKISASSATEAAKALRDSAAMLQAAVDALTIPAARVHQLVQVQRALANTAHGELAALKRRYKSENFSESDIHAVIPDRARTPEKPAAPST